MSRPVRLIVVLALAVAGLVLPATTATAAGPPAIVTASLPGTVQGAKYSVTLKQTGGTWPYRWSVVAGKLPYGLKLSSGGKISGATADTVASPHQVTIQVKDAQGRTAVRAYTITVTPWKITTTTLKDAKRNTWYSAQLKIDGGCIAYPNTTNKLRWGVYPSPAYPGTLPAGLKMSSSGLISGFPKAAGTSTFVVYAECSLFMNGADGEVLTLTVN